MKKYHTELSDSERDLLKQIDLHNHSDHDAAHAAQLRNRAPIIALMNSLVARSGIPTQRIAYWSDRRFPSGRSNSFKEEFEQNGNRGKEIYTHPHFIPFLRYFLYGANLPDEAIAAFEGEVGDPKWVTSGDITRIRKAARRIDRDYRLGRAAEEFFKLCLDMGLDLRVAEGVREAVRRP